MDEQWRIALVGLVAGLPFVALLARQQWRMLLAAWSARATR